MEKEQHLMGGRGARTNELELALSSGKTCHVFPLQSGHNWNTFNRVKDPVIGENSLGIYFSHIRDQIHPFPNYQQAYML